MSESNGIDEKAEYLEELERCVCYLQRLKILALEDDDIASFRTLDKIQDALYDYQELLIESKKDERSN